MRYRPLLALVVALSAAVAPQAGATCRLNKLAELPVTMAGPRPTVSVKINGHAATMMVDSGAFFSGVSSEAAARFGMTPTKAPPGMRVHGVGGREEGAQAAQAAEFEFAGALLKDYDFLVGGRLSGSGVDGMIGENLLGTLEVEYDLANGIIRLFKAEGCSEESSLAYWSAGMRLSQVGLEKKGAYLTQLIGMARLNGHPIRAVFDSGSPQTVLSRAAAGRAGVSLSEGATAGGVAYGAFGAGIESSIVPVASFVVGSEEFRNVRLRAADIDLTDGDMLLGVEFFLTHRMLVSHSQHRLYFTGNGGPATRAPGEGPGPATAQLAQAPPADAPVTADDLGRRAAAALSRGGFAAALADLDRAIALEPNDGRRYYARAMARIGAGQPAPAMSDLNRALTLSPGDARSLMARGQLYAQAREPERAKADFDAALQLQPGDSALPLQAAEAYMRLGDYPDAIRILDRWLAAFPKDESAAQVIGLRCNARAAWGQELEAGLADCDQALRRDGKLSVVMENRGVILLRLDRLDEAIAQFNAALRAQPKAAWSLYGRGLARLRKGAKAEGEADISAAVALRPTLPQEARRFGLIADGSPPPPDGGS